MTKVLIGGFLVAHGLVHMGVWATPKPAGPQPFDPSHSWVLDAFGVDTRAARTMSIILAVAAALGFVSSGIALLLGSDGGGRSPSSPLLSRCHCSSSSSTHG